MTWQEKVLTRVRSFLTLVFFARGGDGSNKLESVVDRSHDEHLVFVTKDKSMMFCYSKTTVVEYLEWDLPKLLSQGRAELFRLLL
jgi:hypothetical protein